MELSFNSKNALSLLKVAGFVAASAALDFLISQTTGSQLGVLTPIINLVLVALREAVKTRK